MIPRTITLVIFGAAIASGQFMPRLFRPTPYDLSVMPDLRSNGCPPAPELAPVICQFMQPNMGLHYKPALIAPSTYIPPLVVEKCDTTQLEIELPPQKPIVIPEAPILPPITIPKFPVPVMIERPMPTPVPIVEPCEHGIISGGSAVSFPEAPTLPPQEMPALPQITVPKFPVPVMIERPMPPPVPIVEPCETGIISGGSAVSIPAAPILPPLQMPTLPQITVPKFPAPVMIERPMPPPVPIEEPCETGIISGGSAVSIPAAPILPPLQMPVLPQITVPKFPMSVMIEKPIPPPVPVAEPCETSIISGASAAVIPPAPVLPPLVMPALPAIAEQHEAYITEAEIYEGDYQSMMIPHPPPAVIPELPMFVAPCPEDLPIPVAPIPGYKPAPVLPPARFPEIPVHVEITAPPMNIERPIEEPCITEGIVVPRPSPVSVPQPPRIPQPMPLYPEHVFITDPCDPSITPVMKVAEHPTYFLGSSSYIPVPAMAPGFLPNRNILVKENTIPRMSAYHFRPTQNVGFMSLPHMRRM